MRKTVFSLLISLLTSCSTDREPSLIGSYYHCLRDGGYQEYRISAKSIISMESRYRRDIYFMSNQIQGDTMIIKGLNFDLPHGNDTLFVVNVTDSSLTLKNKLGDFELKRLNFEIPEIDSLYIETSINELQTRFRQRSLAANCPDLRTREERMLDIPYLEADNNSGEVLDVDELLDRPVGEK